LEVTALDFFSPHQETITLHLPDGPMTVVLESLDVYQSIQPLYSIGGPMVSYAAGSCEMRMRVTAPGSISPQLLMGTIAFQVNTDGGTPLWSGNVMVQSIHLSADQNCTIDFISVGQPMAIPAIPAINEAPSSVESIEVSEEIVPSPEEIGGDFEW
jgi:hypothetical protein